MTSSSERIKKDIIDTLYWDNRVDASNINVIVSEDKNVRLEGKVATYTARLAASQDAWTISDVNFVDNQIDVEYPRTLVLSDEEVKSNIEKKMDLSLFIDESTINISVDKGIVTLEGTVDAYWKKVAAENLASDVMSVLGIENKIAVVPTEDILDKVIAEDIVSQLDRNYQVDPDDIDVEVKNGTVSLSGTVPNWSAFRAATETVENTSGVKIIKNNISIDYNM
ncbi:MAG: BON domain-containing protein [Candidatus Lokiarchaeota archaeon]|nr:BON domain-containing protein [Candidatus Lokiarchaeota archaeon]